MNNEVSLFLLEEEPPQPAQTPQQGEKPPTGEPQEVPQQPGAPEEQEVQPEDEQLTYTEVEAKARVYKMFMRTQTIFQSTKTFKENKLYATKSKKDKAEIEKLILELEDRFELANSTFLDYLEVDQLKILRKTQRKISLLQRLLKLPKKFK